VTRLIYSAIASLDLYINDTSGKFEWAAPDREVHRHVNDSQRHVGTYLYGRRMYDIMVFWETAADEPDEVFNDYAKIWRAADKIVFSRSEVDLRSQRTRVHHDFDVDFIRTLKQQATADLSIGGAELAGAALQAGLIDEIHLYLNPVIIGGGQPAIPGGLRQKLELIGERRFASGVVLVQYRCVGTPGV
jgi:dihydrofolate reductase